MSGAVFTAGMKGLQQRSWAGGEDDLPGAEREQVESHHHPPGRLRNLLWLPRDASDSLRLHFLSPIPWALAGPAPPRRGDVRAGTAPGSPGRARVPGPASPAR